jgi:hypothetical protein
MINHQAPQRIPSRVNHQVCARSSLQAEATIPATRHPSPTLFQSLRQDRWIATACTFQLGRAAPIPLHPQMQGIARQGARSDDRRNFCATPISVIRQRLPSQSRLYAGPPDLLDFVQPRRVDAYKGALDVSWHRNAAKPANRHRDRWGSARSAAADTWTDAAQPPCTRTVLTCPSPV